MLKNIYSSEYLLTQGTNVLPPMNKRILHKRILSIILSVSTTNTPYFCDGNDLYMLDIMYMPADIPNIAPDIMNDIPTGNSVAKCDPTYVQEFGSSIISSNFSLTHPE